MEPALAEEEAQPTPEPPPRSGRGSVFTRALTAIAGVACLSATVLLVLLASYPLQGWPPLVAAGVALVGALVVAVGVPVFVGWRGTRLLAGRGVSVRATRLIAAGAVLWNGAVCVGASRLAPEPLQVAVLERGTWWLDAVLGRGPMGPMAEPQVRALLVQARAAPDLEALAPLLSDEAAAGLAVRWVLVLDATQLRDDGPVVGALDALRARHHLSPDAVRADPAAVDIDGRSALAEMARVVALLPDSGTEGAAWSALRWDEGAWPEAALALPADELAASAEIEAVDRQTLTIGSGGAPVLEARYEDGAWRLHTTQVHAQVAEARARVAQLEPAVVAAKAAGAAVAAVEGTIEDPEPVEAEPIAEAEPEPEDAELRQAFQRAAEGWLGQAGGTTAFDATWPEVLTRAAAVAQAERVRTWCTAEPSEALAAEHEALRTEYGLPEEPPPLAPDAQQALQPRGRRYLAGVLALCAPRVHELQASSESRGLTDARRSRWARLDAADMAARATVAHTALGEAEVTVDGATHRAIEQDGGWRVDWLD